MHNVSWSYITCQLLLHFCWVTHDIVTSKHKNRDSMCPVVVTKNNQLPLLSLRSGSVRPPFWPGKVLDYWLYLLSILRRSTRQEETLLENKIPILPLINLSYLFISLSLSLSLSLSNRGVPLTTYLSNYLSIYYLSIITCLSRCHAYLLLHLLCSLLQFAYHWQLNK